MNAKPKTFELSPAGASSMVFIAVITLIPVTVVMLLLWNDAAAWRALPGWALGLLIGLGPALLVSAAVAVRNPSVQLGDDGLKIRASFVNKTWKPAVMDRAGAKLVNLESHAELRPKWKLWGAAMPGLSSGLFKLYNGEKAHVYITDKTKVVYIPTESGPVLLSLKRPKDFLTALQGLSC